MVLWWALCLWDLHPLSRSAHTSPPPASWFHSAMHWLQVGEPHPSHLTSVYFCVQHVTVVVPFICPLCILPDSAGLSIPFPESVSPPLSCAPSALWTSLSTYFTCLQAGPSFLPGPADGLSVSDSSLGLNTAKSIHSALSQASFFGESSPAVRIARCDAGQDIPEGRVRGPGVPAAFLIVRLFT